MTIFLTTLFILVIFLLIAVVLLQQPKKRRGRYLRRFQPKPSRHQRKDFFDQVHHGAGRGFPSSVARAFRPAALPQAFQRCGGTY